MYTRTKIALMLASLSMLGAAIANAAPPVPAKDATDGKVFVATCKDGAKYYHATGERRGSCSGHGGVAVFADGTVPKSKGGGKTAYK